ncbi:MAG: HAMP domain-containing protein [Bdellovibrionales bacterium]|nr:HAMP domain-containing protein [Bdellovibrionales bacterium]
MKNLLKIRRPKKSLRNLLSFWFLFFSVVPLIFITGYSLTQFEFSIDEELFKRLQGNAREMEVVFDELESYLFRYGRNHATDPNLIYALSTGSMAQARRVVTGWMTNYAASRVSLYDSEGRLRVALFKAGDGTIKSLTNLESGDVSLSEVLLNSFDDRLQVRFRDIRPKHGMELVVYSQIQASRGRLVGYIEEIINIDEYYLNSLKKRLNLEIVLFDSELNPVVSTQEDFKMHPKRYFKEQIAESPKMFFEVAGQDQTYGFFVSPIRSQHTKIFLGLAASKLEVEKVLGVIRNALITVVGVIILLMLLTLMAATNMIVRPINDLVAAAQKIEKGQFGTQVATKSDTELGFLTETFNKMSFRVAEAKKDLEIKIQELEKANLELQDTQAQLVHSAKMVSLGQLVAGVAHELNNPIGFIYSNMGHLKDYSERLAKLAETAQKNPANIDKVKAEIEYDYVVKDLPKLIKSCEDGARRVRDIVLGLRNFSRLEGRGLIEIDLRDSIENTLNLLVGELKSRIQVHADFGKVPKVKCYPDQINQVFMNILSNAAQAIEGSGEIWIQTSKENDMAMITIKDNGKGIKSDDLDHIFDPFFTTKPVGKGTGLGLSITYGIIQKHGGEIRVESQLKKGTTFRVLLPISGPPA